MDCPVCGSRKTSFEILSQNQHGSRLLNEENFRILRCNHCRLIFPEIKVDRNYYRKYYPQNYYEENHIAISPFQFLYRVIYLKYLHCQFNNLIDSGKILDFGCGRGEFLRSLPDRYQKFGLEINRSARQMLKNNIQQEQIFQNIDQLKQEKIHFEIITLWHVLEHLGNVEDTLKILHQKLDPKGLLVISTPNSDSFGYRFGRSAWFHMDAPRHLAIYNRKNLEEFLTKNGFSAFRIKAGWFEYPLDLFWSIYNHYRNNRALLNILLVCFILPMSFLLKFMTIFNPSRAEVITLLARKRSGTKK